MSITADTATAKVSRNDQADDPAGELRIAHVIGRLSIGGAEKHFVSLLNALTGSRRYAILVASAAGGPDLAAGLAPEIEVQRIPVRKRSLPVDIIRLARFFRRERINVVHTHMFWSNLYGVIAAKLAGVPVVVTTEHGENRWKRPFHRWLERNIISKLAKRRFCVSPAILDNRRTCDGVPGELLELVANGTPVPAQSASDDRGTIAVIGSIGRFVVQKNFDLFVDLVAELNRRGHAVKGVLAGDGPEMARISARVKEEDLAQSVSLPGFTTDTDSFFRNLDCYVVTSSEEGQPVSLLEAMSYGLPVVSTDVGAISQTLAAEQEGLIVPPGDIAALSAAVQRFIDDSDFAHACGSAARRRVEQQFSIDAVADRYEERYRDILHHQIPSQGSSKSAPV